MKDTYPRNMRYDVSVANKGIHMTRLYVSSEQLVANKMYPQPRDQTYPVSVANTGDKYVMYTLSP